MRNILKSIATIIFIAITPSVHAQSKSSKLENTLLWEISGKHLEKPSYLYGTIHMICSEDYFLTEKTKKAFNASNKLVLEINLADPAEMADIQKMAIGKEPLSKKLSPQQLSQLDTILKKTTRMTIQQVDNLNLITVMSLISMKSFGCNALKFYEMELLDSAKKRNIEISGLETAKSQMEILSSAYTNDEMISLLAESSPQETAVLVSAYKTENIDSLLNITADNKFTSEKTKRIILDNRNNNWVKKMAEQMKNESIFFAVGSAHLGGEFGVINLLRKAGYIVKPVMN